MSAWSVPGGVAKLAPLATAEELLDAWCEIVRLRLEATLLERDDREIVQGDEPADARRERADRIAALLDKRLAASATPPALVVASSRLGIADPLSSVAILVGYELDPAIAPLARRAGDPDGDPHHGPLRIGGIAAARKDRSPARALDAITLDLASRELATIVESDEPARRWAVRGHRRLLPLAAGRLAIADELPLREIATPDRWLAEARGRRRAVRVLADVAPRLLVREATTIEACVAFAAPPSADLRAALTAAHIPVIVDEADG